MSASVEYVHLPYGSTPPSLEYGSFRALVIIEDDVSDEWRDAVSEWLVRSGCLYMCAWGEGCTKWDDSVDHANLAEFEYGKIPEDRLVMTTWHPNEPLAEAFWFAGHCAYHPAIALPNLLIVHVSPDDQRDKLVAAYHHAQLAAE